MKVQIAHPITSYFDATCQLLRAQGEDFQLTGTTSLSDFIDASMQKREDVYVIDSIMLREEPLEVLDKLAAIGKQLPIIVLIEESEEELGQELQRRGPITLLYKRKGYLTALAEAIHQCHAEHLRRMEEEAKAEALKAETQRLALEEAARIEAAQAAAARAEAASIEAARLQSESAAAVKQEFIRRQTESEGTEALAESLDLAGAAPSEKQEEIPSPLQDVTRPVKESDVVAEGGFFICDRKGRFLSANKNLQNMLKYSEDEILELSLADLLSKEEEQRLFTAIFSEGENQEILPVQLHFIDKLGNKRPVSLHVRMLRDESKEKRIIGFRGSVTLIAADTLAFSPAEGEIDQSMMVKHLLDLVQISYSEPLNLLLKRIGEIVCQIFGFQRSTVALLDRRKKAYVKHAMIGYGESLSFSAQPKAAEVPEEVVDRLFLDQSPVKVIYYNQETPSTDALLGSPNLLTRAPEPLVEAQWHPRDLVLLRLADHRGHQFGYVSIDEPLENASPDRSTFYNLEIFSQMVAMVIENYYRFSTIERRNRRLKQILINSNIFKLYLSLNELLKEVVWSVKFSLEFNLVSLVLISKKSGQLETKAVACDDRIKLGQIQELSFDLKEFSALLREEYRRGKSFLISSDEKALHHLKQIYYGSINNGHYSDGWPRYALLLVPIKSREGKIIGFILADDPGDGRLPTTESVQILEILANQVAIAIDNRMLYIQSKDKPLAPVPPSEPAQESPAMEYPEENSSGLRKLVDRFLR